MENRAKIVKKIKEQYGFLAKQYRIRQIGIFGSVVRDSAGPNSDVDIVFDFERPIGLKFMEFI